jgi:hypothetical protein
MLIIRVEQIEAFKEEARKRFAERVLRRLWRYFPDKIQIIGETPARNIVHRGISAAKAYKINVERDVFWFVALTFFFGETFYRTQQWAKEILEDDIIRTSSQRVALLRIAADDQFQEADQSRTKELLNV